MAMAETVSCDVAEQILVRSDVKDLIQWKRVCRSWYSLISSIYFVKSHLNYSCNNDLKQLPGDRRIARPTTIPEDSFYYSSAGWIFGSSNGLVCILSDYRLLVANPLTAEVKIVLPPCVPDPSLYAISHAYCYGFGYDSCIDDYKVIVGIVEDWLYPEERQDVPASFHVFTSNASSWRLIGHVKYGHIKSGKAAVLCDGVLHWFMRSYQNDRKVILSLDLSTEEFQEIPQPEELECNDDHTLGVIQGCLCIFNSSQSSSSNKWIYNKQQSWELFQCDYDFQTVVHYLRTPGDYTPGDNGCRGICHSTSWDLIHAPIFVQSIVSPHANNNNKGRPRLPPKNYMRPTQTHSNKRSAKTPSDYFVMAKPFPFSHFSQTILKWKRNKRVNFEVRYWSRRLRERKMKHKIYKRWLGEC